MTNQKNPVQPNRQRFTPSAKGALAGVVGLSAATMLYQMVPEHEGVVLKGYKDPIGIPTKCMGDTKDVVLGQRYSIEHCKVSMERQLVVHATGVLKCTPRLREHPRMMVAATDLAYNIGVAGYCRSTAARQFNAGNYAAGCYALGRFNKAGGRVLPGLVKRRKAEVALCLEGVRQLEDR